jgi:hypothetical protein
MSLCARLSLSLLRFYCYANILRGALAKRARYNPVAMHLALMVISFVRFLVNLRRRSNYFPYQSRRKHKPLEKSEAQSEAFLAPVTSKSSLVYTPHFQRK